MSGRNLQFSYTVHFEDYWHCAADSWQCVGVCPLHIQNTSEPEHPQIGGGNVKTFYLIGRWKHELQSQTLTMAYNRVPRLTDRASTTLVARVV